MDMPQNMIDMQTRPGYFHDKIMEYYNTLKDDQKVMFKKTLEPCLPYFSTMDEVQDFIFWLNGADPIYVSSQILNGEYAYNLAIGIIWEAHKAVFNEYKIK